MNSIIVETEETIRLKKKQKESLQLQVNNIAIEMGEKVKQMFHLSNQIETLEKDLNQFKKNINTPDTLFGISSKSDCLINKKPFNRDESDNSRSSAVCSGNQKADINDSL